MLRSDAASARAVLIGAARQQAATTMVRAMADEIAKPVPATGLIDRKFEMRHMLIRFRFGSLVPERRLSRADAGNISPQRLS
jgi:hypothetical protein